MKNQSGRIIEGTGIVFSKESNDLGGFREIIAPSSIGPGGQVLKDSDIVFLISHNYDRGVLARSNKGRGSLSLSVTPEGVKYSFEAPPTAVGDELVFNIQRGEVDTSSFAFTIAKGGEIWEKRETDYLRIVTKFSELFDFSAVYRAAYPQTSCTVRTDVLTRSSEDWQKSYGMAERSGMPGDYQHKKRNTLDLIDMKIGDRIDGDELRRMIELIEGRGINVPSIPAKYLTHAERHAFSMLYIAKASDLKPTVTRAYKLSPADQALYDKHMKLIKK